MLALFALFGAVNRAQAQSNESPGSAEARVEAQERQVAKLKALVLRQAQELQSQQQAINELRRDEQAGMTAVALPTQPAAEDKRESAHLKVNRAHAPPPTNNPVKSAFGAVQRQSLPEAFDPTKLLATNNSFAVEQPRRILQDAFITPEHVPKDQLSIGQFKLPLAREALESDRLAEHGSSFSCTTRGSPSRHRAHAMSSSRTCRQSLVKEIENVEQ
jgi:hypothetical protein